MKKNLLFFLLFSFLLSFSQEKTADALFQEGVKEITNSHFKNAIALLKESAGLARETADKTTLSKTYAKLGEAYLKNENPSEALKHYLLSLPLLKEINDNLAYATLSKEVGVLYADQKKHDLSIQYYTEAIKQAKQLNNEPLTADCLTGIGLSYEDLNSIDKALESYSQALAIYRARGMDQDAGQTLSNMGRAYKKKGDYLQSILNYKEALGYFSNANDRYKVAKTLSSLGKVLNLMEDYPESLRVYEQAYIDAIAIKYNEVIIDASLGMALAYEKLRQYPEAVRYHKIHEQKKDSFVTASHENEIARLKRRYEAQDKETVKIVEQDTSPTMLSSGKIYKIIAIIGFCIFVLLVVLFFLWRRNQLQKNKEDKMFMEAEGEERLRLVQDIHNDLDSKLTEINYLSESIVERTTGMPTIRSKGEAMQETTKKIEENIRDLVWLLTPNTTTLTNYVGSIKEYVLGYFKDTSVEVLLSASDGISLNIISKESQRELLAVIKESLISITEDPQATKVFFGITYSGTRLMISIKDNGQGLEKKEADKKRIENNLQSIGGIMRIDSEAGWGTMVKIIIPLRKPVQGS